MPRICALFIVALMVSRAAAGGLYNKTLEIGAAAPAWKDLPGVDGKRHSLADLKDKEVVVVVFTCNSCPYAVDCEERLIALADKFSREGGKCALVAIGSNQFAEDSLPAMQKRASEKKFHFPYLHDEKQELAKAFGATRTPEFFVLDRDRKVAYMGALDDSPELKQPVTKAFVELAITASLAGKKADPAETPPVGCLIRVARNRQRGK